MEIITITIEHSSKNILVDFLSQTYSADGTPIGVQIHRCGYNPLIPEDWDSIDEFEELSPYKAIAWRALDRPIAHE